jgi:site-specific DNA-methyltransferase (adenine-specific)/modification methylase
MLLDLCLSKAQISIVWGGNYFELPPSRCWLSWVKPDAVPSMANIEMAWTNINRNAKHISCSIAQTNPERVAHPTQKPLKVMVFSIEQAGNPQTILDPFMGSGTTGVAAIQLGRTFTGIEREAKYFDIACKRIEQAYAQGQLFDPAPPVQVQESLI